MAFGADHINTASTINNLGNTYTHQGKYDEAIAQYERALRIKEKAFGADHINTADTIMNIGLLLKSGDKIALADVAWLRYIPRSFRGRSSTYTKGSSFAS